MGLSLDIKMSDDNKKYQVKNANGKIESGEGRTSPFDQVVDMRSSSIHKWLAIFAKDFNFHPYGWEPWHWEYNYKDFKDVFFADSPALKK